jgi:hypothetical protein
LKGGQEGKEGEGGEGRKEKREEEEEEEGENHLLKLKETWRHPNTYAMVTDHDSGLHWHIAHSQPTDTHTLHALTTDTLPLSLHQPRPTPSFLSTVTFSL